MPDGRADLLQGTLDLLILQTVQKTPLHGWAISKRIRERSANVLDVNQGSPYPALYRLEARGLILADEGLSEQGRRVRVYRLSAAGKKHLAQEMAGLPLFSQNVARLCLSARPT